MNTRMEYLYLKMIMQLVRNILLVLLLFPTLAAFAEPYFPIRIASYFWPFTLISIPFLFINLFVLAILICGKSHWKWIYGLMFVFSLFMVSQSYGFHTTSKNSNSERSIRIISWNVDNFMLNIDTLEKASRFINKQVPDIICFQERPHDNLVSWDTIRSFYNYPFYVKNSREDEVLNLAVFSQWPLSNFQECYFKNSYNKFFQVDIHCTDKIFRLFNVHLQTTGVTDYVQGNFLKILQKNAYSRNLQANQLKDSINKSPYPVIVCGDFNDTPQSYAYHKIKEEGLADLFSEVGRGWGGSYQFLGNLFRIDYMMCTSDFKVMDYQLYTNPWSDHKIQYGEIQVATLQ